MSSWHFSPKPSYATSTCQWHLTHKVQVTYLQVTIWRCSRYMHSPWMQKFLYSISQGVPFFLFFPLFFFLLDLPEFFSPPLFVGLGLTTGSTEKRTRWLSLAMLKSYILRKLNYRICWGVGGWSLQDNLQPGNTGCKWVNSCTFHIQHKGSKLRSSLSSTLPSLTPVQCRPKAEWEDELREPSEMKSRVEGLQYSTV